MARHDDLGTNGAGGTVLSVRKALVVALVLLVVLTGVPLAAGMGGMVACPECGPANLPMTGGCLVILATALMLVFTSPVTWLCALGLVGLGQLVPRPLEHPPRVA